MFRRFQVIRHIEGEVCVIVEVPDERRLLAYCDEPYYIYRRLSDDRRMVIRQSEMEDGRFINHVKKRVDDVEVQDW